MTGDDYAIVTTIFRDVSPRGKALFCDGPASRGGGRISIPRSLVHGADDMKIAALFDGDEFTFRLRRWKAEELGLA